MVSMHTATTITSGPSTLFHRIYKSRIYSPACLVKGDFVRVLFVWVKSLIKSCKVVLVLTEPSYALMLEEFKLDQLQVVHVYRDYPSVTVFLHDLLKNLIPATYVILDMNDLFKDPNAPKLLLQWSNTISTLNNTMFLFGISKYPYNTILSLFEQSCPSILEIHKNLDIMHATFYHTTLYGKQTIENLTLIEQDEELRIEPIFTTKSSESLQKLATFKVELTLKEQQERNDVELPFLKAQTEPGPRTGLPNVIYYADKADDLDEEDPDADLEF